MTRELDRRSLLALTGAAALVPFGAFAQQGASLPPATLNRLAHLAGFDPLPRDLLRGLGAALAEDAQALEDLAEDDPLPDDLRARLLTALYTGVTTGENATRIGFASALMWAAIEESNNVISYCGGLPGFWAKPPDIS